MRTKNADQTALLMHSLATFFTDSGRKGVILFHGSEVKFHAIADGIVQSRDKVIANPIHGYHGDIYARKNELDISLGRTPSAGK